VAAKKKAAKKFSITKAVKANARERLGPPPAERVIADKTPTQKQKAKHKETLADILSSDSD
jgi:hypothetical protein